jgi:hypothetical protein
MAITNNLVHKYLGVNGAALSFIRDDISVDAGKTFTTGPAAVSVQLKVQLTTPTRTVTPVFRGAVLEEL